MISLGSAVQLREFNGLYFNVKDSNNSAVI
jgi:hypothetical protein